jgi:hypothetical protein
LNSLQQRRLCQWQVADCNNFVLSLPLPSGVGPEISAAVKKIFEAARVPVTWDEQHISKTVDSRTNSMVTRENLDSVLVSLCWARLVCKATPGC